VAARYFDELATVSRCESFGGLGIGKTPTDIFD
jgi:hypothetical protein